jgi:hypothetical protein
VFWRAALPPERVSPGKRYAQLGEGGGSYSFLSLSWMVPAAFSIVFGSSVVP